MALKRVFTRKELKERIGDWNVFKFYFPHPIELHRNYISVFRDEQRASTSFIESEKTGSLIYKDFGDGNSYDFVQFVARLFGITYYKALERIAIDFGLTPGVRSTAKVAVIKEQAAKKAKVKKKFVIDVIPFTKAHLDFWAQFGLTKTDLVSNNIQAINGLQIDDWQVPPDPLRFLYIFNHEGKRYFKIYTPHSVDYKWISSVPLAIPFGLDDVVGISSTLVITKSVKDCLVLRKYFPEVIGLQNEGKGALTPEMAEQFKALYKTVYVWFDVDRSGIKAANYYKKKYGFIPVFVGNKKVSVWKNLLMAKAVGLKDPSDFVKVHGLAYFEKYLKHINLYPLENKSG